MRHVNSLGCIVPLCPVASIVPRLAPIAPVAMSTKPMSYNAQKQIATKLEARVAKLEAAEEQQQDDDDSEEQEQENEEEEEDEEDDDDEEAKTAESDGASADDVPSTQMLEVRCVRGTS